MRDLDSLSSERPVALLSGLSILLLTSTLLTGLGPTRARANNPYDLPRYEPIAVEEPAEPAKKAKKKKSKPSTAAPVQPASDKPADDKAAIEKAAAENANTDKPTKKAKAEKKPGALAEKKAPVIPAGPVHVVVSVKTQKASFFANGTLVATTAVSTGTKTHPTPMGVFSIIQKNKHHVSNLYGAKMPYMQRLTWSGTALHTGPLPGFPASHGCIRLTNDFAQTLWGATRIGARVIVTRDEAAPLEFAHARLFAPKKPAPSPIATEPTQRQTGTMLRTADATGAVVAAVQETAKPETIGGAVPDAPAKDPAPVDPARLPAVSAKLVSAKLKSANLTPSLREAERKAQPISVFISRKDSKLYVRQNMEPLFDSPVTIREPTIAFGTHVFTAMELKDGGSAMRWTVVSIPSGYSRTSEPAKANGGSKKKKNDKTVKTVTADEPVPAATAALDRIEIPQDAVDRIAELLTPGSSLVVSDNGISSETGKYTDFIILTR
jgi:lipoprotein-anchoring transpeptidase ErfK/SrfK